MRDARRQRRVDVGFGQPAPRDAPARQAVRRNGGDGLDFIGSHRRGPDLNLIDAGRPASEPMAFICNAATGSQQVLETTLGEAPAAVAASGLEPPAVVVVGEVVRLRASLDWLGALAGRRLAPDPFGRSGKVTA